MTFKEWWEAEELYEGIVEAELAWDHQQERIDKLETLLTNLIERDMVVGCV